MTQAELATALAEQTGNDPAVTTKFIQSLTEYLTEQLTKGEAVAIPGVGTFELVARKERAGRHPRTGETITIPASTSVHFRPSPQLKRSVNP